MSQTSPGRDKLGLHSYDESESEPERVRESKSYVHHQVYNRQWSQNRLNTDLFFNTELFLQAGMNCSDAIENVTIFPKN